MNPVPHVDALQKAIASKRVDLHSLLFVWLATDTRSEREYVEVAQALLAASEHNLAHLAGNRGLANFPKSDALAMVCLRLEMHSLRLAA